MDHNSFDLKNCKKNVQNRGKVYSPVAKGSEVQFSLNLFSRNFLEPEPELELEPNFVFGQKVQVRTEVLDLTLAMLTGPRLQKDRLWWTGLVG